MSDLVEKVARALCRRRAAAARIAHGWEPDPAHVEKLVDSGWPNHVADAEAAIEAVRAEQTMHHLDALAYGMGVMKDGVRVAPSDMFAGFSTVDNPGAGPMRR